jgi:hypothetical protein
MWESPSGENGANSAFKRYYNRFSTRNQGESGKNTNNLQLQGDGIPQIAHKLEFGRRANVGNGFIHSGDFGTKSHGVSHNFLRKFRKCYTFSAERINPFPTIAPLDPYLPVSLRGSGFGMGVHLA